MPININKTPPLGLIPNGWVVASSVVSWSFTLTKSQAFTPSIVMVTSWWRRRISRWEVSFSVSMLIPSSVRRDGRPLSSIAIRRRVSPAARDSVNLLSTCPADVKVDSRRRSRW